MRDAATNFDVTGSYLVFADLWTSSPPTSYDNQCAHAPRGNTYGWRLKPGSHHITIKRSRAVGLHFAVWVNAGSHHNRIVSNEFVDINVKDPNPASDAGAVAVAIHGDDNEVAWNHIEGSDSCSRLYGRDGAAIDIYGGQRNVLHHNVAVDNNAFLELGHKPGTSRLAEDTTVAYNEVRSRLKAATFLVVRGADDKYGPTLRTDVRHNSVYLSGTESYALQCTGGCTPDILVFRDNIVWARDRVGFVDGTWSEARNVWWSPTRSEPLVHHRRQLLPPGSPLRRRPGRRPAVALEQPGGRQRRHAAVPAGWRLVTCAESPCHAAPRRTSAPTSADPGDGR